jgi:flagellar basal-body rod protein FlgF
MDPLTMAAAGGMRSRLESLDLLANNLANASAPGFKADSEFYNLYVSADASAAAGSDLLTEPVVDKHWTNFSQGSLTSTSNPLDLAVSGKGFFAINSPTGTLFTRDGSFSLSAKGELVTKDGYTVRRQKDGKAVQLDATKPLDIAADGTVLQDGLEVAKLDVVEFSDNHVLSKEGQNYFKLTSDELKPTPSSSAQIVQGKLETANVQPAESAARLVTVMRQFEMLQKAMSIGMDMNKKATDDVARVT